LAEAEERLEQQRVEQPEERLVQQLARLLPAQKIYLKFDTEGLAFSVREAWLQFD
jgi:hypothetical protein